MNNLCKVSEIVKDILEENEQARNSDSFLYLRVLEKQAVQAGYAPTVMMTMSVSYFLLNGQKEGFSAFETVRRTRQKLQHDNPHLRACRKVETARMHNESVVRDWARGQ